MTDEMVNLHGHSTFSDGDGYQLPVDHVAAVVTLDQPGLALTEHGNISSHVQLERAANAAGVKPIFGYEAYCARPEDPRGQLKNHMTLLAMDAGGYRNLQRLVTASWDNFKYKPTTTGQMLADHSDGMIALSGCLGGRLAVAMLGGKGEAEHQHDLRAAANVAARMREVFGDRYYLEVQPHATLTKQHALNLGVAKLSRKMGIPMVATGDVHYPLIEHQDIYPLLHAIARGGNKATLEAASQDWEASIELTYHTSKQVMEGLRATGMGRREAAQAVGTTMEIYERCNVTLPKLQELVFPSDIPGPTLFRKLLSRGWRYRGFDNLTGKERRTYRRRVKYELGLIESKGFIDYFLVVGDMVRWAKDNGIPVGPARGSAAASLVCYLLRITEVDPMLFPTLLFERFIDVNRHDLPDIDLDFDDEQRYRVREYLVRRYGEARVGNIGTFTMYRGKNSLESVARVYGIPIASVEAVKDKLIERSSGDLRGNATIEDTIAMFPDVAKVFELWPNLKQAQRLEGNIKGFSVHAAGLVVSQEPLTDSVAVYKRTDAKGNILGEVLSVDKYDAEYLNVLKIDVLGLTTMGVIRIILEMVGLTLEDLYRLPLDDEAVYEGFRRNEVIGIFQFDGRAMRSVNREVKPDTFMEVCDINALARPGPLHSGAAAEYIMVKHGKKKAERHGGVIDHITEHTNYQIVYQEQILQVVREIGGFTWEEAALIRKLISKKQGEQAFNRMKDKFVEGAQVRGLTDVVAERIWKQLVTAGAYAFNAAHCVSYGMLAYWTMWLKQHYPLEFYCASLQKYDPKTKGFDLLKEAHAKGLRILPPHPLRSQETWAVEKGGLRAGLVQVKGIGEKMAARMVEWRQDTGARRALKLRGWEAYQELKGFGPATTDKIEAFCAEEDPFGLLRLTKTLAAVRAWLKVNAEEAGLFRAPHRSENVPYEAKRGEYFWVGIVRERNLKDIYELHRSRTGEELDPATVREPEYVNYAVILGEDETGPLTITVQRWGGLYEKYKDLIWGMAPDRDLLLVHGFKRPEYRRAIYASELHVLNVG
jgi:DNA polymerase III subunit alpha